MMSKISNLINMDKASLKKLSKSELINLLLKQHKPKNIIVDDTKPVPTPRTYKPVPAPRKSVKDMVQQYEDNIISPPPEFRDDYKPIPAPKNHYKLLFHHQNLEMITNPFQHLEPKNHQKNQFLKKELSFHKSKKR